MDYNFIYMCEVLFTAYRVIIMFKHDINILIEILPLASIVKMTNQNTENKLSQMHYPL